MNDLVKIVGKPRHARSPQYPASPEEGPVDAQTDHEARAKSLLNAQNGEPRGGKRQALFEGSLEMAW